MREQKKYQTPEIEVTRFDVEMPVMNELQSPWDEGDIETVTHNFMSEPDIPDLPLFD